MIAEIDSVSNNKPENLIESNVPTIVKTNTTCPSQSYMQYCTAFVKTGCRTSKCGNDSLMLQHCRYSTMT